MLQQTELFMWQQLKYKRAADMQRYNENFGSCQPFKAVFSRGSNSCLDVQLTQWDKSCWLIDFFNPHFNSRQLTGLLVLKILTFLNENTILHNMSMQCLHSLQSAQPHVLCVYVRVWWHTETAGQSVESWFSCYWVSIRFIILRLSVIHKHQ